MGSEHCIGGVASRCILMFYFFLFFLYMGIAKVAVLFGFVHFLVFGSLGSLFFLLFFSFSFLFSGCVYFRVDRWHLHAYRK